MRKVLVTGGAGFIGSHVNLMLNEAGYETSVIDNLSRGSQKAVLTGHFYEGDLLDEPFLDSLFKSKKFDAVMHFAALADVGESFERPLAYYRNNVQGTLNLFQAMQKHGVDKLIFSSSAAVYGYPEETLITETHPLKPINPYGRTKMMIEKVLSDSPFRYISLRYFNAAGGDPHGILKNYKTKENNLIPLIIRSVKDGRVLKIYGDDYATHDGTCIRDYIHVYDLASAHLFALEKLKEGFSGIYNLGNGAGFSVKEVIHAAEKTLKRKIAYEIGERRPGDPAVLIADSTKARAQLNWIPNYSDLEKIIRDAWLAIPKP